MGSGVRWRVHWTAYLHGKDASFHAAALFGVEAKTFTCRYITPRMFSGVIVKGGT